MPTRKKKIPLFRNSREAAEFWGTHSMKDYIHDLEPVDNVFVLSPDLAHRIRERSKKRLISIRLAEWQIEKSKQIAKAHKIPYQTLMRKWIDEGLRGAFAKRHPA